MGDGLAPAEPSSPPGSEAPAKAAPGPGADAPGASQPLTPPADGAPVPPAAGDDRQALAARPLHLRRRRHPGQWVAALAILAAALMLARDFALNGQLGWPDVGHYLLSRAILQGVVVTIELTVISQVVAIVIGFVLAAMQQSANVVLSTVAQGYVFVFRSVPLLVQILFWYNLGLVFPRLSIGLPFTPVHVSGPTNTIITPTLAAILALGLHEAAYMAEIVRAGILAVPRGQVDAALSIGMTRRRAMRRIVLPQTLRVVVPPTGNQFIGLLKASSLVAVIGGNDLLTRTQQIYSVNLKVIALLTVASIWYLVLTSVATVGQHYLEAWLERDQIGGDRPGRSRGGFGNRLRHNLSPRSLIDGSRENL